MPEADQLIKTTVEEIEKVLTTKSVVGEPKTFEGTTIIPLVSIGFAFGAGAGMGASKRAEGEGGGGGGGGGGGVRPVGVIIVDSEGKVKVEPIKSGWTAAMEKAIEAAPEMVGRMRGMGRRRERPREEEAEEQE